MRHGRAFGLGLLATVGTCVILSTRPSEPAKISPPANRLEDFTPTPQYDLLTSVFAACITNPGENSDSEPIIRTLSENPIPLLKLIIHDAAEGIVTAAIDSRGNLLFNISANTQTGSDLLQRNINFSEIQISSGSENIKRFNVMDQEVSSPSLRRAIIAVSGNQAACMNMPYLEMKHATEGLDPDQVNPFQS